MPRAQLGQAVELSDEDRPLFEALRTWRRDEAKGQGVPPYVILHDRTLAEIARARPSSLATGGALAGCGQAKLARYGAAVRRVGREG